MTLLTSLALAALIAMPALAQDAEPPRPRPDRGAAEAQAPAEMPAPLTRDLAGPYLAARMAAMSNDYAAAADYYQRALAQDPDSSYLADSALVAQIAAGRLDGAVALADQRLAEDRATQLSQLIRRADLAQQQDWTGLLALLEGERPEGVADEQLMDGMLRGWALLGAGRAADADAAFESLRRIRAAQPLIDFHMGLAKAMVGDHESAVELFGEVTETTPVMSAIARAQALVQIDRRDEAIATLEAFEDIAADGVVEDLLARLRAGEPVPFEVVRDPRDGVAQVFLTFATILTSDIEPGPLGLIHARLASYVSPEMTDARLMVAQMLQSMGQFEAAEAEFDLLREQGRMRPLAELSRIDALSRADRMEDAERAARALTQTHPDLAQGWLALGDLLRQQDRFDEAVSAYDRTLSLIPEDDADRRWYPLYARAISYERSGRFDRAEPDLRAALAIRPDNAQMLNYLGYSYVDRGENLDEALELIERAVELSPDDGYILDSLGWVYYRLGRYEEAVEPQERSVAVMADDPLVNDHLGDIYWKVGRKREAEIQWRRALSLEPETPEEAHRIREKIERGLDAVLEEEAANGGRLPMPDPASEPASEAASGDEPGEAAEGQDGADLSADPDASPATPDAEGADDTDGEAPAND